MDYRINRQYIRNYSKLELLARQVVEGFITGLHKSPFHGFSVEFAEHRQYNQGESTRHIDWKLYARTEKLFVKRYEEETNLRCRLIIDKSPSMYFPFDRSPSFETPNKITFAVYAAAAIMEMLKGQRDAAGLSLFAGELLFHSRSAGSVRHFQELTARLEALLQPEQPAQNQHTDVTGALHQIAAQIHKRSLVILFSDMFDHGNREELFKALQHLKYNKHEVILFHITEHQRERELDYQNRPYRFVDAETGEVLRLNPAEVREAYRSKMAEYYHRLKLKSNQYGIDFVEVEIDRGFHQVLMPYFMKRKKMM